MIPTVKGFSVVSEAELDYFLEFRPHEGSVLLTVEYLVPRMECAGAERLLGEQPTGEPAACFVIRLLHWTFGNFHWGLGFMEG